MIGNTEKITREFCQGNRLLFFPRKDDDAICIQQKFFAMGYKWGDGDGSVGNVALCVEKGMVLSEGKFYTSPNSESLQRGFLCTVDQFDDTYKTDRELLLELFNRLAAIEKQQAEILAELRPQQLDKPILGKKEPGAGR